MTQDVQDIIASANLHGDTSWLRYPGVMPFLTEAAEIFGPITRKRRPQESIMAHWVRAAHRVCTTGSVQARLNEQEKMELAAATLLHDWREEEGDLLAKGRAIPEQQRFSEDKLIYFFPPAMYRTSFLILALDKVTDPVGIPDDERLLRQESVARDLRQMGHEGFMIACIKGVGDKPDNLASDIADLRKGRLVYTKYEDVQRKIGQVQSARLVVTQLPIPEDVHTHYIDLSTQFQRDLGKIARRLQPPQAAQRSLPQRRADQNRLGNWRRWIPLWAPTGINP